MKFKVDENLPEELSQLFRQAGWDCATVAEQQLGGADDPEVAQVSNAEQRVLVTFDRGFSNIKAYPPSTHPGMIVFRLKRQDKRHVLEVAARLVAALTTREIRRELWIVQEDRIRIRAM